MLFNSYLFIFGFLPVVLAGFYLLGAGRRNWALLWLTAASLVFYAWWRPINVLLIAPSILINYGLSRALQRTNEARPALANAILITGIVFNIGFLGYFKYLNFIAGLAERRLRHRLRPDPAHPAARHLLHNVPEDRLPGGRPGRPRDPVQHPRLRAVRAVLPAADRRPDRALPGDDAAVPRRRLPLRCRQCRGRPEHCSALAWQRS